MKMPWKKTIGTRMIDAMRRAHGFVHLPLRRHWDKKYRRFERRALAILFVDLALALVLGTLVVAWIFTSILLPAHPVPDIVKLELATPDGIVSGAATAFAVNYENATGETLGCAVLDLELPEAFHDARADGPDATSGCAAERARSRTADPRALRIPLGDVPAAAKRTIALTGVPYGATGSVFTGTVRLSYWLPGDAAPRTAVSRTDWSIAASPLSLTIAPGAQMLAGRVAPVTVTYANAGEEAIEDLVITLAPPDGFRMTSAAPLPQAKYRWSVGTLAPGAAGSLTAYGVIRAGASGDGGVPSAFRATATVATAAGEAIIEEAEANADVRANGLMLTHEAAGDFETVSPGDTVRVLVAYRNAGTQTIKDLKVRLHTDPALIADAAPASLVWDATASPELASLAPGAGGTLEAVLTVGQPTDAEAATAELPLFAAATFYLDDGTDLIVETETKETALAVTTSIAVRAGAFYYTKDGEQLGVGPFPPVVGQETRYRIVVSVTNSARDVQDATFTATLPEGVTWTGRQSVTAGEALDYLPSRRQVRWKLGTLTAGTDGVVRRVGASFEVAVTPRAADSGREMTVLSGIVLTGMDVEAAEKVDATAPEIGVEVR